MKRMKRMMTSVLVAMVLVAMTGAAWAVEPAAAGGVVEMWEVKVPGEYPTIQKAIDATGMGEARIQISEGTFDGFVVPAGKSIHVFGVGPEKTRIVDFNATRPWVVYASVWGPYGDSYAEPLKKDGANDWDELTAKGGGIESPMWQVELGNLSVYNGKGKRNDWYTDAAVFCEGGITLTMSNCVVTSESNRCVATNYADSAFFWHCNFIGAGWNEALGLFNEGGVDVTYCIFSRVGLPVHVSNGGGWFAYNCIDGPYGFGKGGSGGYCYGWYQCDRNYEQPMTTGFVFADPQLVPPCHLAPSSPCISAADGGFDIGAFIPEPMPPCSQMEPTVLGDVNDDKAVDALDVQLIINLALGM